MKTALIGLGRIGWHFHLNQLLAHKEYEVCAVVDTSPERLAEAKELYGIKGYTDYKEMLKEEKPQLTVIASPTIFHEEHAVAAMESGSDVILDKPMAQSFEAAKRIYDTHKSTKRKLIIYQPHRFTAETVVAQRIINSGKLGEIYDMKRSCMSYSRRNDWQAFKKFGGGMLANYGAHYVDQLVYLAGEKVVETYKITANIATLGDANDVVKIVMKTENNKILDVDISQAAALPLPLLVIYGKYGAATLVQTHIGLRFIVRYYNPEELAPKAVYEEMEAKDRLYPFDIIDWKEEIVPVKGEDAIDFYALCYEYFTDKIESPIPVEQTIEVMRIISAE